MVGERETLCTNLRGEKRVVEQHCILITKANLKQDWLSKMNVNKKGIWPHLEETYGKNNASIWFYRWQIFYMACAELFGYDHGDVWGVTHYLFRKA